MPIHKNINIRIHHLNNILMFETSNLESDTLKNQLISLIEKLDSGVNKIEKKQTKNDFSNIYQYE